MCTNSLIPPKWSWKESVAAVYEGSWNESTCINSLIPPKWSWKESVYVTTLLVVLIPAVLSVLYGDVVLLHLWLFCLCLGCMGDVLLSSMVDSPLLHSMVISPLSTGVSLVCWVLIGSMVDFPFLCSMGMSLLSMGVSLGWWLSLELSVCWLPGSVLLVVSLSPSPPSMANFFSETKLKASFGAVSQFAVLALTQLSKVLKEIDLLFVVSMVLKETCLVALLSKVLKEIEIALLTSCSVPWRETFFLPTYPWSWKKSVCLDFWPCLWLCWHYHANVLPICQ